MLLILLFLYKYLVKIICFTKREKAIILFFAAVLACLHPGTFKGYIGLVKSYGKIMYYNTLNVETLWGELGVKNYINNENIVAKKGKNIIVIYCESLEDGFFRDKGLSQHTSRMNQRFGKDLNRYTNYNMADGAQWTVGALYSTNTGLPTLFSQKRNTRNLVFKQMDSEKKTDCQLATVPKILEKAGYKSIFLSNNDTSFNRTDILMRNIGYEVETIDALVDKSVEKTVWGVHDRYLFEHAKRRFLELKSDKQPFNMLLLTVDMHWPKGVPDKSMEEVLGKEIGKNGHEFTVETMYYLLDDFINFIEKNDKDNTTEIVILGDHLMAGTEKSTKITSKLSKNRKIALLTTSDKIKYKSNEKLYFYNIPRFILDAAEVDTNVKFPAELIQGFNPEYIKKHREILTVLNLKLNYDS